MATFQIGLHCAQGAREVGGLHRDRLFAQGDHLVEQLFTLRVIRIEIIFQHVFGLRQSPGINRLLAI